MFLCLDMILLPSREIFNVLLTLPPKKNPGYVPDVLVFLRAKLGKTKKREAKQRA